MRNDSAFKVGGMYRYGHGGHPKSTGYFTLDKRIGNFFIGRYQDHPLEYIFDLEGKCLGFEQRPNGQCGASITWSLIPEDSYDFRFIFDDGSVSYSWCTHIADYEVGLTIIRVLLRKNRDNYSIKLISFDELKDLLKNNS